MRFAKPSEPTVAKLGFGKKRRYPAYAAIPPAELCCPGPVTARMDLKAGFGLAA